MLKGVGKESKNREKSPTRNSAGGAVQGAGKGVKEVGACRVKPVSRCGNQEWEFLQGRGK